MGKKYLDTKKDSLESSVLGVWKTAIEEGEAIRDAAQMTKKEVELDEGYEKVVLLALKKKRIDGYFKKDILYVDKSDVKDAKDAIKNDYETILVEDGTRFIDRADADKTRQELKDAGVIFK